MPSARPGRHAPALTGILLLDRGTSPTAGGLPCPVICRRCRQVLKAAAAIGVVAMVGDAGGQVALPATKPATPLVGIQIGAGPLSTGNIDTLLDQLRNVGGINTLFVFAFGHEARFVPMAQAGFRGGNYSIPHMEYYKDSNLSYDDMRAPEFPDVDLLDRTLKATR